ncbi:hypothetical protein COU37_05775 [Candidatus Micrarchaeota archaeon CG10_big_fil_rev_8_21_14_0_10_45_29]|nr:MAG: hypothetical protein COU37_05775 [Candidatus Micrarchaeota archaeon CG10_big_fil_rev_8_21_14_0_10_45_29]
MIREAKFKDIPAMQKILQANLLSRLLPKLNQKELGKRGFLVDLIPEEKFVRAIHVPEGMVLVSDRGGGVSGYALAYDSCMLLEENINLFEGMLITPFVKRILEGRKILYLDQIVAGERGDGHELLKMLMKLAASQSYEVVLDHVLQKPVLNTCSVKFHRRNGFSQVGEQNIHGQEWIVFAQPAGESVFLE